MQQITVTEVSIALGVILSIVALIKPVRSVYLRIKFFLTRIKLMWDIAPRMESVDSKLTEIHQQLITNGGSSLRDAINRIEKKVYVTGEITRDIIKDDIKGKYTTDVNGLYDWTNRTYLKMIDKELSQLAGDGWQSFVSESDRDRVIDEWVDCMETGREFDITYSILNNGRKQLIHNSARPIKSAGTVVSWVGDITLI